MSRASNLCSLGAVSDLLRLPANCVIELGLINLSSIDPGTTVNPANSSNRPNVAYDGGYGGVIEFGAADAQDMCTG